MPRTSSAKKAERASLRKRIKNTRQANVLDKFVRDLKRATEPSAELKVNVQQALDKAAKTGLVHHRTAARLKSRLLKTRTATTPSKPTKAKSSAKRKTRTKKTK